MINPDNNSAMGRKAPCPLEALPDEQRAETFAACAKLTIPQGTRWLEEERGIVVSHKALGAWLRKRRAAEPGGANRRKTRVDSKLGALDPEVQDAIFDRCCRLPLREGVKWLEQEHGLELSVASLANWLCKCRETGAIAARLGRLRDMSERISFLRKIFGTATEMTEANSYLVAQMVFEEFLKEPTERDEKRIVEFMKLAMSARGQELRARAVDLSETRFQFNAAAAARERAMELQEINAGPGDEHEKTLRAIRILFGERPGNTTFAPESAEAA